MPDAIISSAVAVLKQGGIIAYPTESVFGFGVDPRNETALLRLINLKRRNQAKGLIVIASDWAQLETWLMPLDEMLFNRVMQTWPGPTTWVLPAKKNVSNLLRGEHDTLAVRVTAHPLAKALCAAFEMPIVSTSANREGETPCKTFQDVERQFANEVDFIVPGLVGNLEKPTEIRDGVTGDIIRPG